MSPYRACIAEGFEKLKNAALSEGTPENVGSGPWMSRTKWPPRMLLVAWFPLLDSGILFTLLQMSYVLMRAD
jgi:hypothetical protein